MEWYNMFSDLDLGAVLHWGRGAQAPQMLATPPPNILVPTAKIRIVKI